MVLFSTPTTQERTRTKVCARSVQGILPPLERHPNVARSRRRRGRSGSVRALHQAAAPGQRCSGRWSTAGAHHAGGTAAHMLLRVLQQLALVGLKLGALTGAEREGCGSDRRRSGGEDHKSVQDGDKRHKEEEESALHDDKQKVYYLYAFSLQRSSLQEYVATNSNCVKKQFSVKRTSPAVKDTRGEEWDQARGRKIGWYPNRFNTLYTFYSAVDSINQSVEKYRKRSTSNKCQNFRRVVLFPRRVSTRNPNLFHVSHPNQGFISSWSPECFGFGRPHFQKTIKQKESIQVVSVLESECIILCIPT